MANYNLDKQKAYDVILHLVDNFQNGIKSKNETETRRYYIERLEGIILISFLRLWGGMLVMKKVKGKLYMKI